MSIYQGHFGTNKLKFLCFFVKVLKLECYISLKKSKYHEDDKKLSKSPYYTGPKMTKIEKNNPKKYVLKAR